MGAFRNKMASETKLERQVIEVEDFVKLKRSQLKDKAKSEKLKNIVLFAFQEALKDKQFFIALKQGKKTLADLVK